MKVGTKSVLFGVHQFLIHPWFVAWAWWRLYGFPWDPRLWVSFFVHDLGYLAKPNMDGKEGEEHVKLGAHIVHALFDACKEEPLIPWKFRRRAKFFYWWKFCMYHSRFWAKAHDVPFSRLCVADKLSIVLTPAWLYLPLANLSGEIHEYMALIAADDSKYTSMNVQAKRQRDWYRGVQKYLADWVKEHRDGREDTWTPKGKEALNEHGVWK